MASQRKPTRKRSKAALKTAAKAIQKIGPARLFSPVATLGEAATAQHALSKIVCERLGEYVAGLETVTVADAMLLGGLLPHINMGSGILEERLAEKPPEGSAPGDDAKTIEGELVDIDFSPVREARRSAGHG